MNFSCMTRKTLSISFDYFLDINKLPKFGFLICPTLWGQFTLRLGGGITVAVHLANAVGGDLLLGFLAAVTFATIVAVVAGLALAGARTVRLNHY